MKTLLTVFLLCFSLNAFAATNGAIDISTLTATQKAELALQAAQMAETAGVSDIDGVLTTLSKFEGIGRETGVAVREGLTAVVDVADKFGDTSVGQITIALIVWRIAGADITLIVLGLLSITIGIWFMMFFNRRRTHVTKFENIPVLGGLWTRKVPVDVEHEKPTDTDQGVGVIGMLISAVVFVVCIANVG
jgi:hypothetical protein